MNAKFTSKLNVKFIGDKHIKLNESFSFIDKRGVKWTAPAKYISDGATFKWTKYIPGIGHPFDGDYIESAVIHDAAIDKYEKNNKRSQKDVHRAFREALEVDKVNWFKRNLMWLTVRIYNRFKRPDWK